MPDTETAENQRYKCERCGYTYERQNDRKPYLCLRCIRFIAKSVFSVITTDRYKTDGEHE